MTLSADDTCIPKDASKEPPACTVDLAVGNPINAGSGNKHHYEALTAGSAGLTYSLTYISRSPATQYRPAFAHGVFWTSSYQATVAVAAGDGSSVVLQRPNGQLLEFTRQSNGTTYLPDADVSLLLTRWVDTRSDAGTGWVLQNGPDGDIEIFDSGGKLIALSNLDGRTQSLGYDSQNRLASVTDDQGHQLQFTYDAQNRIYQLIPPDGGIIHFTYDAANNLSAIRYPDGTSKAFHYEDPRFPNHLTGVTDEANVRYATWSYDAQGRAISSEHASGIERHELTYNAGSTDVKDPLGTTRTKQLATVLGVVKSAGESQPGGSGCGPASSALTYDANGNVATRTDFNGATTTYTYDLNRNLETQRVEASGKPEARTLSTQWHPYWRLPVKHAEPKKLTTYIYNGDNGVYCAPPTATVPSLTGGTQPIGALCARTEQATTDSTGSAGLTATVTGTPRTWTYTYNAYGQVLTADGPRTDVADLTTTTYHPADDPDLGKRGQIATLTNALGHVTRYTAYDPNGRLLAMTDPNGTVTTFSYTPRGWLKTRSIDNQTTTYDYTPWGGLKLVSYPDGTGIAYTHDGAHRLIDIADTAGRSVHYTLDPAGNRTKEEYKNADGSLAREINRVFDALGRLKDELEGTRSAPRSYGYTAGGEPRYTITPKGDTTTDDIDALGRPWRRTDPQNGSAQPTLMSYDGLDQLVKLTAPNGAVTSFTVDGLGNVGQESSADRGTVDATFDEAGNLKTRKDARGVTVSYTYDALNRPLGLSSSDGQRVDYIWDSGCPNGIGRLCQKTDAAGSTGYAYDARGNLLTATRIEGGETFVTRYAYNAADRPTDRILPTAETVVPTLDASGQVQALAATGGGGTTTVASDITYAATGAILKQALGFWLVTTTLDSAGRADTTTAGAATPPSQDGDVPLPGWALGLLGAALFGLGRRARKSTAAVVLAAGLLAVTLPAPPLQAAELGLDYEANGNVISRTTASGTTTYTYDKLDRLDSESGPAGVRDHDYDANGNRSTDHAGTTATYTPNTDRLATINGVNVTLDAAGYLLSDGTFKYVWDGWGNLKELRKADNTLIATYHYDDQHLRTRKVTTAAAPQGATTTFYHYDLEGHLVAETTPGNQPQATYIWNGDILTGYITYNPRTVYAVQVDHLGSPYHVRTLEGKIVWRWESDGYGRTAPNEDVDGDGKKLTLNHRFPGQYYDVESGLHYNHHRFYSPKLGRYISADPIGLAGGDNLYAYVYNNPIMFYDPYGLWAIGDPLPQGVVDFSAGLGDALLLGFGDDLRGLAGVDGGVNECSSAYQAGGWTSFAFGGARLAYAGLVKGGSILASSGATASAFRNNVKVVFRGGFGRNWRPPNPSKYPTDAALRAAAGRSNPGVNAYGAGVAGAGAAGGSGCGCEQ